MFKTKRIYELATPQDGYRILVDRLWPRGIAKTNAHIDEWFKEIAPSNELRKWFGHQEAKWPTFQTKYVQELKQNQAAVDHLKSLAKKYSVITLLYGARDTAHNQAVALMEFLNKK